MTKKSPFAEERGVLLSLKISDFGWKRGIFSSKIREKEVFFKLGYEHGIRFSRECVCVCVCGGGGGGGGGGGSGKILVV